MTRQHYSQALQSSANKTNSMVSHAKHSERATANKETAIVILSSILLIQEPQIIITSPWQN